MMCIRQVYLYFILCILFVISTPLSACNFLEGSARSETDSTVKQLDKLSKTSRKVEKNAETPKELIDNNAPKRLHPSKIDCDKAGAEAIRLFDTDKNGKLSGKELDKCPGLKAALKQIDRTNWGAVTAKMIANRIKAWQDSKLGRMSLYCTVLHNGRPLQGAKVDFVPEKFLGKNIKAGTGVTDQNGIAMISISVNDRTDPPGVAPGFYRVEITKEGVKIPAKYNIETILGQEVALDAEGIQKGVKFNLKF